MSGMGAEPPEVAETAQRHFFAGCAAQKSGDLEGAAREYEASLQLVPGVANSLFNLGLCRSRLGQFPEAAVAFRGSLEPRPGDAETLLELGAALRASGDPGGALAAYRAAFRAAPERLEADANRALGLEEDGLFGSGAVDAVRAEERGEGTVAAAALPDAEETRSKAKLLGAVLRDHGYTALAARARLGLKEDGRYTGTDFQQMRRTLSSAAVGEDSLGVLLRLFLLGQCLPRAAVGASGLPLGTLERVGALVACPVSGPADGDIETEEQPPRVSAPVQVYPLDAGSLREGGPRHLLLATDWGTQSFLPAHSCVMQIGNDTLELLQAIPAPDHPLDRLLDLCCGSGVQGLAALANGVASSIVAVDINPRCVHFTRINAALNGYERAVEAQVRDLYGALERRAAAMVEPGEAHGVEQVFDAILVNPPFVAVPSGLPGEAWSMYADGGPDGMAAVRRILEGASARLRPGSGWLLLVGEMPNVGRWEWLARLAADPAAGLDALQIFCDPAHTYSSAQYAFDRASERHGTGAALWEAQLAGHGVLDVSNVLFSARSRHPSGEGWSTTVRVCALRDGDPRRLMSENHTEHLRHELRIALGLRP